MNKKILVVSIVAVFTLVAISFASAVNTTTPVKKKESPLYRIRLFQAIREKGRDILSKFIGERIFFLPTGLFRLLRFPKILFHTGTGYHTCWWTDCWQCTDSSEDCTQDEQCTWACKDWTDYPPCTSGIPTECGWYTCKMEEPWCNTESGCSFAC